MKGKHKKRNHKKTKIRGLLLTTLIISTFFLIGAQSSKHTFYQKAIQKQGKVETKMEDDKSNVENNMSGYNTTEDEKLVYLSDLNFITSNRWSYVSWGSLNKDLPPEGNVITLKVDNKNKTFIKGVGMHAEAQLTVDISAFSQKYTRFISKAGVDASRGTNGNGVWFKVSVSKDGETWENLIEKSSVQKGNTEALDIDVNVAGYKYLRIYADNNGNESADHAVLGDAKFVTTDYVPVELPEYDKVHPLEHYDNILKNHDVEYNMEKNYKTILEREFVRKVGYDTIKNLTSIETKKYRNLFDWILSSDEVLEQVIEVGEFQSTKFINNLADLYEKYQNERNNPNWYVYQKMMIALSAAHSSDPLLTPLRFGGYNNYNVLTRFEVLKDCFDNKKFKRLTTNGLKGTWTDNEWFKDYSVPLMRTVVHDAMSDIDFTWLNGYSHDKIAFDFWVVPYISPNYNQARFYDEENREKYTEKYLLDKYNVPYGANSGNHYWMVIEGGGICWNESRFGQALYRVNGLPAVGAYQPGHECFFNYYQDEAGNGYWTGRYGSWGSSGTTWGKACRVRYPLDWANKYFADQNISGSKGASSSGYLYLAQANLNEYDKYQKSLYYNLTTNSYTDHDKKLEAHFKSLEVNKLNLDTYDYIINSYKNMSVKNEGGTITSNDWHDLSLKIIDSYTYYPVAMYDLLKVVRPYLDGTDRLDIDRLEKEALNKATKATSDLTNSPGGAKEHANWLLGKTQADPMTFSFDGENAGKIVRNPDYQIAWGYSLDGGKTFTKQVNEDSITLTKEEIESITEENDIIISFMGLSDYRFKIDITKGTVPNNLYANDLENRVIGINLSYEWRNSETDQWTSYANASPNNTGDKTLHIRVGATGHSLPSETRTFTFTEDNQPETEKYVNISKIKLHSYSSQQNNSDQKAANALDGNINTMWHSVWNGNDKERYIIIELNEPIMLSALEYYPRQDASNGRIKSARISVSMDGNDWTDVVTETNWADDKTPKKVRIDAKQEAKYVKLSADTYYGDGRSFISATMINLFEDMTNKPAPIGTIEYSCKDPTTENVTARIINMTNEATVTNNGGSDTYVFTENGSFDFKIKGKYGKTSTIKAKVDWIDRTAPKATIEYSTINKTNNFVVATLKPNEDIIVTSKTNYNVDDNGNVTDINGNILKDYTVDKDGNIKDLNENIITNINENTYVFHDNGEFTFEFMDLAGNKGTTTAKVEWIDRIAPTAELEYDKSSDKKTIVKVVKPSEEITFKEGNGTYEFTKNGTYEITIYDKAGNATILKVVIDWLKEESSSKPDDKSDHKPSNSDNKLDISGGGNKKTIDNSDNKLDISGGGNKETIDNSDNKLDISDDKNNETIDKLDDSNDYDSKTENTDSTSELGLEYLGKYAGSYKNDATAQETDLVESNNTMWFVIAGIVTTIGLAGFLFKKRKRKHSGKHSRK